MNKQEVIKKFAPDEEGKLVLARVLDKLTESEEKDILTYTKFLNEQQQHLASCMLKSLKSSRHFFAGGYEGAQRVILYFLPTYLEPELINANDILPLAAVRVEYPAECTLSHRDFLGSLMGLGQTRETVGDILVGQGSCDLVVLEEIKTYLLANWEAVGRVKVKTTAVPLADLRVPEEKYVLIKDTVASLRLDNIISAGFALSRSKAGEALAAGRVRLNYLECMKSDKLVQAGDVISLKGKGKIKLEEISHQTKKGRMAIVIKKYL
ncbi:MAG TPA: RNA-binding protein [Peptococcaceae bacterium]|nr:RNA-binding protein [Peptococcaceae bacterium]